MWKFVVGLVKKLKPTMSSALPVLLFTTFILLNVAIWLAGSWLEVSGSRPLNTVWERAQASIFFSLIAIAGWGVWQWRKLQGYYAEFRREEALREDPIKLFEQRQENELNKVMLQMKDSLNKRNYLYTLPWYLILGLENAGKTSLINRSGQNFVFSTVMRASGQTSENPYSFDWWIGNESVLIDPDGELLTQGNKSDEDGEMERRLWLHFVNWLDKTRSRRPLNGIVLTVDLSHLATSTTAERKAYAGLLRARIRELMETLSTRLPVYVSLTKFDLLYGFEQFFKHYTKAEREDVFGFTFSLESVSNLDSWLEEFSRDYNQFKERLNALLPLAVAKQMSLEERNAIYSFTRQLAGLQEILTEFLKNVLSSDQFSTSALVRGVYFTSVYQQGVPTNAFDDAASRRYGLSHAVNAAQQAKNSTVYFTRSLFSNIIYPEAGLASDNFRVAKQKRRLIGLSVVACSVASALLVGTWHRFFIDNNQQSDAVLSQVNQYKEKYPNSNKLRTQQDILEPLNKIREATLAFGFFREKPKYISDFGLYQGHTIGPKVEETYLNLLKNRFLPLLMADILVELSKAKNDEEKLAILRVYRMVVDKSGRYKEYVLDFFSRYWQKEFAGQRAMQEELAGHLDYALRHTDLAGDRANGDANADKVLKPYDKTIVKVQTELGAMPNDQRVYRNLKLTAETVLGAPLNLRNLVGPVFDLVYEERVAQSNALYIPQMLTKRGFEEFFLSESEQVSDLALIDSWVLGQSKTAQFSEADKKVLRDKIRDLYVADYINTWRLALNEIDMKYFQDINDAVTVLDNLTGNLQPLQRLLRSLEANTLALAQLPSGEDAKTEILKSAKYQVVSLIQKPFSELNSMLMVDGEKPSYINEVLVSVEALKNYLKNIQDSPDVGMAALKATKARIKLVNADPIYTLKRISSGLPKPLDSMLAKLADESWHVIKQEAIKHLEVRWYEDVYQTYETKLATRYPFDPNSKNDAALNDFESFFAPEGTLDSFYNNQLKMFIEDSAVLSHGDEQQSIIRKDVLEQIEKAKKIQTAFFNRKGILDVNFAIEPLSLSNNKRRSVLNIDGQYVTYSHGPRESVDLIWPNTLRDSAVSKITLIPAQPNQSPRSINIQGPWALFRLLEQGEVVSASSTAVDFMFAVDEGNISYRVHAESDANPFTDRLFKSFKLSKTLY